MLTDDDMFPLPFANGDLHPPWQVSVSSEQDEIKNIT